MSPSLPQPPNRRKPYKLTEANVTRILQAAGFQKHKGRADAAGFRIWGAPLGKRSGSREAPVLWLSYEPRWFDRNRESEHWREIIPKYAEALVPYFAVKQVDLALVDRTEGLEIITKETSDA